MSRREGKNGRGSEEQRSGCHLRCAVSLLPTIAPSSRVARRRPSVSSPRWQRPRRAVEVPRASSRRYQRRHVCCNSARGGISRFFRVPQDHVGEPPPLSLPATVLRPRGRSCWSAHVRLGSEKQAELWLLSRRSQSVRYRPQARCKCERSEEHTSELQSQSNLVCRLLL